MKKYILVISLLGITSCDNHQKTTEMDDKAPAFYQKKWDKLPEDNQVLGPVADPSNLDTVSIREKRQPKAFDEDDTIRDGHAHRAGFFQNEEE